MSSTVSATTACSNPAVPGPSASADAIGNITVTWTAVGGATAYTVYRSDSSTGTYTAISTGQTAATYTDAASGLSNGNTYYYVVSASNAAGQCSSSQSAATSAMACAAAAVPIGLVRTVGTSGQVALNWTASTGATQYTILRGTSSGAETVVATAGTNSYTDSGLTDDTTYYYAVKATNGTGNVCVSAASSELVATPRACQVLPATQQSTPKFDTLGPYCFVLCWNLSPDGPVYGGWGWSNFDGRTLTVNGQTVPDGGGTLPALSNGAYTFSSTGGTLSYASIYWWGNGAADCPP